MGDSDDSATVIDKPINVVYSVHSIESTVDPPMEEWSSLEVIIEPEIGRKRQLYREGLYDPGDGELCAEYVAMSASSVLRHPYYNYPAILDPGIEKALLEPEDTVTYPKDGQALYLALCEEMNQCPVRIFHRGLLESQIDLRYYCIDPKGFRAMAKALQHNTTVLSLNLTENFLNHDACFHMGDMLLVNNTITEINLAGCRIGPEGARRLFYSLPRNRTLKVLNLSRNKLRDEGIDHIANAVFSGLRVQDLNLSDNNITGAGVAKFIEPFEAHNHFTHLDLSWNTIFTPGGYAFFVKLAESECLEVLNLAWNGLGGPRIGIGIKKILLCPTLTELNLANNMLKGAGIRNLLAGLKRAAKLKSVNFSYNPMSPTDAFNILMAISMPTSKVRNLIMEYVDVNENFVLLLESTKEMKSKKNLVVTYGNVVGGFVPKGPDVRNTILNRVDFLNKKKGKLDIALFALQLQKDNIEILNTKDLYQAFRRAGANVDEDIVEELAIAFPGPGPKNAKVKTMNVNLLVDYVKRKWPDRELPPTPPPEPEPEPIKKPKGKEQKKGKK